jgi:DNA-binding MurR/RpiR family transcriptional regulator
VRGLTREQVEECVGELATAQRVVIVAMDQMAFFASYLRHMLALLDIRAECVTQPRQESITRLGNTDENTLVVCFTAGRAHPLVVRAMKLARHRGARTIAISDATLSEVGEHAEHTLYWSSDSPSYTRSTTALLSLVEALSYGVYARDKGAFKDRIRAFKLK